MKEFDRKDHVDKVEEEDKLEEKKEKSIEEASKKKQAYNFDKYNEQFEGRKQETIEDELAENNRNISFDKYQKQLNKDITEQQNEQDEINPEVDSPEVMEAKKVEKENIETKKRLENMEENAEEIKEAKESLEGTNGGKNPERVEETPKQEEIEEGKKLEQSEEAGEKNLEQVEETPKQEEIEKGKKLEQSEEAGEKNPERVEETPKQEEIEEGKKLEQSEEAGEKNLEQVEETRKQEETEEGKKLDQSEETGEKTQEQVEETPKQEGTDGEQALDQSEEAGEKNSEQVEETRKQEETDEGKKLEQSGETTEEDVEKNPEQVEETPKQEETDGENQLDQAGETTEETGGKNPEQVEEMPKQEGTDGENQLDQAGETTEETGGKNPEQVEETPKQEETDGENQLDQAEETTEETGGKNPEQVEEMPKQEGTDESKALDQTVEPTEEAGEKNPEQVEEMPEQVETEEDKKLDQWGETTEEDVEKNPEQVEETPKKEETEEDKALDQSEEPLEQEVQEDENPSETRENIEETDSSEGSREEETVKKEFEPRSETEEESGFDLDKLFDQKKKEIDQRTIGQILKERKDAWREAGYGDSFKEMWKNAIQAQVDAAKEGRLWEYNKEEFRKEIKHVYEDGMKLANKVIENNKILGPIKEVLEERNKKWNEAGEGKYTLKSSIEAQIEAAKQGPKAWWEYNKKEFSKEIKTAYEDCAKMADKITDNYQTLKNIKVSLEERHQKRIEDGEGATLLEMCKNSVRAQIDAAKEDRLWEYNKEEFRKEIKNVYEDGVKIADKITDTYKVIANAKVSLRERHEKRIEDGEGATLLEMCKNSVRAQIDAAKEGRLWEYNKEEFRKEIKNVYEDSMKVANKMIEGNKILFSIKEVVIEREKIWSESGDEKYTLKGSIKAQIEAIKQGPAEWFKYNKEEFSREIKTVYEDSMKVADKIIDKYKPLADARDVLEARDKKWREAGEANTIISSFKAQLEVANKSPKAWWDYNIKGIQRETRHLFEDGRMYLIKYMDTPGLFDEVDDKASEKKDDTKKFKK
ncbi:TPA: hypothetical protein QCY14_003244 [Bacillus pacificus]|nr:hypothetical protein [Bacillus cereus]HDR7967899.1 hypothetical protein [Bacillus pacificus]